MPKLVYTDEMGEASEHVIGNEPVTIGRSPMCDVVLPRRGVGRLHATLERAGGKLLVRHEGCSHGTWVKGARIDGQGAGAELDEGDEFKLGECTFTVKPGGAAQSRPRLQRGAGRSTASRPRRPAPGGGTDGPGAEGAEGAAGTEDAEGRRDPPRGGERLWRGRQRREILGGVKLSKMQQTVVKIICAVIMLGCIVFGMQMATDEGFRERVRQFFRGGSPQPTVRVIHENPLREPRRLSKEAQELWREADRERSAGNTAKAYELVSQAKDKIEESQELWTNVTEEHQGEGFSYLHNEAMSVNRAASGIRNDWLRLKQQVERDGGHRD